MIDLSSLDRTEVEAAVAQLGVPRFHGRQVFHWIYRRGVTDFAEMTDLGRELRTKLAEAYCVSTPVLESQQTSADGTTKFLLRLQDDRHIESVYIPDTPAQTFC